MCIRDRLSGPAELVPTTDLTGDDLVLITGPDFGSVRTADVQAATTVLADPAGAAASVSAGENAGEPEAAGLTPAVAPDTVQCG